MGTPQRGEGQRLKGKTSQEEVRQPVWGTGRELLNDRQQPEGLGTCRPQPKRPLGTGSLSWELGQRPRGLAQGHRPQALQRLLSRGSSQSWGCLRATHGLLTLEFTVGDQWVTQNSSIFRGQQQGHTQQQGLHDAALSNSNSERCLYGEKGDCQVTVKSASWFPATTSGSLRASAASLSLKNLRKKKPRPATDTFKKPREEPQDSGDRETGSLGSEELGSSPRSRLPRSPSGGRAPWLCQVPFTRPTPSKPAPVCSAKVPLPPPGWLP